MKSSLQGLQGYKFLQPTKEGERGGPWILSIFYRRKSLASLNSPTLPFRGTIGQYGALRPFSPFSDRE
jgi:hypothetical protein